LSASSKFPENLISLIHAGEKSGSLSMILSDFAAQVKEEDLIKNKIKSVMIYPVIVVSASLLVVGGMMVFIVPKLVKVYNDTGVTLPAVTEWIVSISDFVKSNYGYIFLFLFLLIYGVFAFGKTKKGRKIYDILFLYLPIIKNISKESNIMSFTNNMGILLEKGIMLAEAMNIVSNIVSNHCYKERILLARKDMIAKGFSLAKAFGIDAKYIKGDNLFPSAVLQSIYIGEQTGTLGKMMSYSGEMYKERLKNTIKGLSEIIEPFVIIFLGVMISVIVLAIMLPLFQIGKVMRQM